MHILTLSTVTQFGIVPKSTKYVIPTWPVDNPRPVRDAIITCVVNTATCLLAGVLVFSILGYMAFITGSTIHDVVNSGPGLVFLTYPDLVLSLPGSVIWATIFFVMLLVLGIDSEFCNVEALVTGIVDNWPDQLLKHRRKFTMGLCFFLFCLGLPLCTHVSLKPARPIACSP